MAASFKLAPIESVSKKVSNDRRYLSKAMKTTETGVVRRSLRRLQLERAFCPVGRARRARRLSRDCDGDASQAIQRYGIMLRNYLVSCCFKKNKAVDR